MTVERSEPSLQLPERAMLDGWLDYHRATLAMKCDGLSDEQLRLRSVPPSSLSLLGLVRHMADVERQWFRAVLAGEEVPPLYWTEDDPDADFDRLEAADREADFAAWEEECRRA